MPQETKLNINRVTSLPDRLRAYIIVLDGLEVGQIKAGESLDMSISPGDHRILLKIDWCRSNALDFTAQAATEVTLNCGSSLTGWKIFLAFLYISFLRDKYLWIQEGAKIVVKPPKELPEISKRAKLAVLAVFAIFASCLMIEPVMITKLDLPSDSLSPESLIIMKVVGILLSIYGLVMPWFIQPFLSRIPLTINQNQRETLVLLFGYIFLITPVIFAVILFNLGLSLVEFYYFVAVSIIVGIVWGAHNYVKG